MSDPFLIRIPVGETASLGLELVDRSAVGYSDAWQAPDGKTLPTVAMADYNAFSAVWQCQVTSASLNSTPNITQNDRAGTFCRVPGQTVVVGEDTIELSLGFFQDLTQQNGLSAFLYENSSKECFFYFAFDNDKPPRAIGRCRLVSGSIGGDTHTDLTATAPLPVLKRPDLEVGIQGNSRIIIGSGTAPGRDMARPGSVYPADPQITASDAPNAAKLAGEGFIAIPVTAWTTGQKITIGTFDFNWSGTAWAAGAHA